VEPAGRDPLPGYNPLPTGPSLADRLKVYRQVKGLSQEKLAALLGVNESTLWKWESGKSKPNREHRRTIEWLLDSVSDAGRRGGPA
jgi:DNA-binding transcriptional regulator YiaG